MARYRTYKNGITGHRYKGYYIIKGETKGTFAIWNKDKSVFKDNILDYEECEWIIDKATASPTLYKLLKKLYEKEIFLLTGIMLELIQKKDKPEYSAKDKELYDWVVKIRKRKVEDRLF